MIWLQQLFFMRREQEMWQAPTLAYGVQGAADVESPVKWPG